MNRILIMALSLSIFQAGIASAQEINTDIVGKKMSFFKKLEAKNKGKVYETDGDIIIPGGMAMPIMYRRVQKEMPDLIVNYVFTKKDSLMHTVAYTWDLSNYGNTLENIKPLTYQKAFVKKYIELLTLLTAKYGASESKGTLEDFLKNNNPKELKKSDKWVTRENTEVYLYTFKSHQYKPVFKISLYISPKRP
jgi:hypothetical protein